MTIGALLDPNTWDLQPEMTPYGTGLDLIGQQIRQGLQIVIGEWILDREAGAIDQDWFSFKPVDVNAIGAALRAEILDNVHVTELRQTVGAFDPALRALTYSFDVTTDEGELTLQVYPTGEPATAGNRLPYAIVIIPQGGFVS